MRTIAVPGALVLVALLILFGLVRPGLKAVLAPTVLLPGAKLNAVADEAQMLPTLAALPAPRSSEHLESAKLLARQNPAAVAGILRGWVGSDQPASR